MYYSMYSGGTGTTFYQAMINQQEQRNAKVELYSFCVYL